jgi:hypothetical protein
MSLSQDSTDPQTRSTPTGRVDASFAIDASRLVARARRDREREVGRRIVTFIAAIVIAPTAFGLFSVETQHRDGIAFSFWEFANRDVMRSFKTRDGIIREWNGWGFAGNENDSYLVAAHDIGMMSRKKATEWAHGRGETVDCEIVDVQKKREAIYIFTTYECVLKT